MMQQATELLWWAATVAVACAGAGVFWSSLRCGFCFDDHLAIDRVRALLLLLLLLLVALLLRLLPGSSPPLVISGAPLYYRCSTCWKPALLRQPSAWPGTDLCCFCSVLIC
jgi:hypothetical protein